MFNQNKRWGLFFGIILILALVLTACNSTESKKPIGQENAGGTTEINNTQKNNAKNNVSYKDIKLTPEQVFNIFMKRHSDAKVEKLKLEQKHSSYYYKVEGYDATKKYELKLEPVNGNIIKEEQENLDNVEGEITLDDAKKVNTLVNKVQKDVGNNYIINEWELKVKNAKTILDIEVANKTTKEDKEFKYNVKNGELIKKD